MTAPEPNTAELVAIYQHIKTKPAADLTSCGTALQFAGRCVFRAGAEALSAEDHGPHGSWVAYNGKRRDVVALATELLGLTGPQAIHLLFMSQALDDIRRLVIEITGVDPELATS